MKTTNDITCPPMADDASLPRRQTELPLLAAAVRLPPGPRRLPSDAILGGCAEVEIVHGREVYRLRHTSTGKLILTK